MIYFHSSVLMDSEETRISKEFTERLTSDNIISLKQLLDPPAGMFEDIVDGFELVFTLLQWEKHDTYKFDQGLSSIGRSDLVPLARKLPRLSTEFPVERDSVTQPELSLKSFVNILKDEIQKKEWWVMRIDAKLSFEAKIELLINYGRITADLSKLIALMQDIKREDLAEKITEHQYLFADMSDNLFIRELRKEVESRAKDLVQWKKNLREFVTTQNKKVKQTLDDEDPVDIESVYVPLTIVGQKPEVIKVEDETTYNEIEFLRKIANEEVEIVPVDFEEELKRYDPSQNEIWCVIGNPGSGKTFLCHRTALRFCKGQLSRFLYSVSIPCRNPEWHDIETSRIDSGRSINAEFIQKWLCLGMPIGPRWTSHLAEHLVESDGQDLLLIIDSMDEFVRGVPFEKTLLFLLLARRTLTQCTIILTSRPGAYFDISSAHTLHIDRFFHVLGFSPENRDLYFQKQLEKEAVDKMKEWKRLLYLHDEIDQLSLVPVNASLFASLVKEADKVSAQTLTQLYTQLSVYLIRRQLYRMGLQAMGKKSPSLALMHPDVVVCLRSIGEIAYQGVAFRKLTSSSRMTLLVDKKLKECQCLGLVIEHLQKDSMGVVTKVWSFAHLTMQEFIGAFWLSKCSWGDQCASVRYIVNSNDMFNLFRMVLRFLCGLLCDSGLRVLYILYKYYPNTPVTMIDMPIRHQFAYCPQVIHPNNFYMFDIHSIMGWTEFTEKYLSLSALLFESNSDLNYNSFPFFRIFLPQAPCFYFDSDTLPNEWECFLKSLPLLHSIQLIYFDTRHVPLTHFRALLTNLTPCSLRYLVLKMHNQDYSTLSDYSNVIRECQLPPDTREISLELYFCNLTSTVSADMSPTFTPFSSLCLVEPQFTPQSLQFLGNQLIYTENLSYDSSEPSDYKTLLSCLNTSQLTGLHLHRIPSNSIERLETILPQLSKIQEIALRAHEDIYSLLPYMSKLSNLKYLELNLYNERTELNHLIQLLIASTDTLRGLKLHYLHAIGLSSCSELFSSLSSCSNLMEIELYSTKPQPDDLIPLSTAVSKLKSLLYLLLHSVPLSESGMSYLCKGLLCHPTFRRLDVYYCKLNSNACVYLTHLISTLKQFKTLNMSGNNLSEPDPKPVKILEQTADMYYVTHECLK